MRAWRGNIWAWFWLAVGAVYFLLPLYATAAYSLQDGPGKLDFSAYTQILQDPDFRDSFLLSFKLAVATAVLAAVLMVPTVYWVHLRLPRLRPVMDFIAVLPFVIPPITLAVGILHVFQNVTWLIGGPQILAVSYVVLALPFMYRALDAGMRSINLHTLSEAAQSVGAGWLTVLIRIILPNLRFAILSGIFLTITLVMGEYTMASLMLFNTFSVYMQYIGATEATPAAALAIISFALTWLAMLGILILGRGVGRQPHVGGAR
jgi:putative spermidine/putrescine transport system permease protein